MTGEVVSYFKGRREVIRKRWVEAMQAKGLLAGLSADELEAESARIYDMCVVCLETGKSYSAQTYANMLIHRYEYYSQI